MSSSLVPQPTAPPTMSALGDPIGQAEKFVVEIFEDTTLWDSIDEDRVPTKNQFGPRAIIYGGWFPTCAKNSFVCVNDRSESNRGAMCIYDCTNREGPLGGRFSPEDVEQYIKVPPYKRTDKTYHPNIAEIIEKGSNIEAIFKAKAETDNLPVYSYQIEQGTEIVWTDESTEENIVYQPHLTLTATSWLPNDTFEEQAGYPRFEADKPFEIIWSYNDNTQETQQKEDAFYEVKSFGTIDHARYGLTSSLSLVATILATIYLTF